MLELLTSAYAAFNERDLEGALATMHEDVDWPNGMEGGYVHGHQGVRDYWTRQWGTIDPHVEPVQSSVDKKGWIVLDVRQVVHDLQGNLLQDQMVQHAYLIENGLIRTMEIREMEASIAEADQLPGHTL
jgi:hypothetical protein